MVEVAYLAKRAKISLRETLERAESCGCGFHCPGGGAEIFSERVRRIICDHKIDGDEWLETARTAHEHRAEIQLHDALRPYRDAKRTVSITWCGCGSCRMRPTVRHLHSAGVSSGEYGA